MTTGSDRYILDVVYDSAVIGKLTLDKDSDNLELTYTDEWRQNGFPLSPHLPLDTVIPSAVIRKYLQNLLPENQGLDYLIEFLAVSKFNIFALKGLKSNGTKSYSKEYQYSQKTGLEVSVLLSLLVPPK